MKRILGLAVLTGSWFLASSPTSWAGEALNVVYPANGHKTTATQIFLIGTAPAKGDVTINGKVIERSPTGNFAPSFPLNIGENTFNLQYGDQQLTLNITRTSTTPSPAPTGWVEDSLEPKADIAKLPNEPVCFQTMAQPGAQLSVQIGSQTVSLQPQQSVNLPPNSAALTQQNQPQTSDQASVYQGCTAFAQPGVVGKPVFQLTRQGQTLQRTGSNTIEILSPQDVSVIEVTSDQGVARTGPSTNYSRLTPLPKGTQARITGREGEWLRLDYGAWIKAKETRALSQNSVPHSIIRSIRSRQVPGWTEVVFPLQTPVPISVQQGDRTFTLTLHNTTAQTDVIFMNDDPVIRRLDWQQPAPNKVEYQFNLKPEQQWGYKLRYDGTSLILSLRHPPAGQGLSNVKVLLDPGHGSPNDLGARGPTGLPEKDVTIVVSKLLQQALQKRGATVVMTREGDDDLYPQDRVDVINQTEPTIAISVHYNALPDSGDAENTAGIGAFWYHAQSHDLAVFLHHYLVDNLKRPDYGIFWDNLALTRPTVAPTVLMELGFMIHPTEFEWITDPKAQEQLAESMADAIAAWCKQK
ncbi:N-acetylmuramoyl-L-alanine amidase [Acaryochloris sp. IP29b_bin.148]|uniref:N-acetylmuramoyl-L-alanine amidase n=1 Tax=Acaryochloris sp. IP29b_bin.148 TaxID=2969218 RepID=UPI00262A3B76|nr:N-acetylmuramoyl-L-alanine amidase [Acaryochloris sp. IP29b_bin.148]